MSAGEYSGLRVSAPNGVKVYQVTSGKDAPKWLSEKHKRKLRKDSEFGRRVELVQDLEFSCASSRAKLSPDGNFLLVSGIHPPQVKVYDLSQLSMKFERHLDSEVVDFCVLGEDYSKLAFMCADRTINFHAKFGKYYTTRTPRQGRDMTYVRHTGDLMVVGGSCDVYRLNLEQGRFLAPMKLATSEGGNKIAVSAEHGLCAVGTEDGTVECFDSRTKANVGVLNVTKAGPDGLGQGVTSLTFDPTGMRLATGDHDGIVRIFDLRSDKPLVEKDHMYGSPIIDVKYHTSVDGTKRVMSTDKHVVKFWDPDTGTNYCAIEPGQEINDALVWDQTGLVLLALENKTPGCYFAPSLGAAPKWCSFLENLTEEMEETVTNSVYDDYRFITREELEKLGMSNLIGTKMLRAYMHGFFVDNRLYGKAKAISQPFSYDEYKQQRLDEKLVAERASRITVKKKLPKVNASLAARLEKGLEDEDGKQKKKGRKDGGAGAATRRDEESDGEDAAGEDLASGGLLKDDRFAAMFKNAEFEVDETSETYRALHPNAPKLSKREREALLEEHFDLESEEEAEAEEGVIGDGDDEDSEREEDADALKAAKRRASAVAKVKMYAAKDEKHADAFREGRRETSSNLTLAERAALERETNGGGKKVRVSGNKELRFEQGERDKKVTARKRDRGGDGPDGPAEQIYRESGRGEKHEKSKPGRRGMGGVLPKTGGRGGRGGGGRGGGGRGGGGRGKR